MKKINRLRELTFIIFIMSPLLSLPLIIKGIYHRDKVAFFLFAIFMGFAAYLTLPFADLFRHTLMYYDYGKLPSADFKINFGLGGEWFIPVMDRFLYLNGIGFEFLRLLEAVISFLQLYVICNWFIKRSDYIYTPKQIFSRFIILFLFFEFLYMITGMRFGFAMCQYIFGLHLLLNLNKKILSLIFFYFACAIHTSFNFFIPITFLIYITKPSKKNIIPLFMFVLLVSTSVEHILLPMMGRRAEWYFSEDSEGWGNTTIYGFIFSLVPKLCTIPFIVMLIRNYSNDNKWARMYLAWLILGITLINNFVVLQRVTWVLNMLGVFLLMSLEWKIAIKYKLKRWIMYSGIALTLFNTLNFKTFFLKSDYYRLFYPVPVILSQEYELDWILRNIDNNSLKNSD